MFLSAKSFSGLLVASSCLLVAACGQSSSATSSQTVEAVAKAGRDNSPLAGILSKKLRDAGLNTEVTGVSALPVKGWYRVTLKNQPSVMASEDGNYVIQGELLQLEKGGIKNISQDLQGEEARNLLAKVPARDMIVFSPQGKPKAAVYVFTDVDCGYCRKLHAEMKNYNARGIEVRYLAWPRAPQYVPPIESVWCSPDRKAAMTTAKQGMSVAAPSCQSPVMAQHALGSQLGVSGTPAVFTEKGEQIGGYLPPDDMARALKIN